MENKELITIAADIGGTHITAAQMDESGTRLIEPSLTRRSVNAMATVKEVIEAWSHCMQQAAAGACIEKVCLAMPGPFDYEAGICLIQDQSKYPALYGRNVKELLGDWLGINTNHIYIHNDAACFLQGEVASGSVHGYHTVIGITLGTGLGSAVYKDGAAHSANLWKLPFKDSIAEEYLSTRWFVQRYTALTGKTVHGVKELAAMVGDSETVQQLFNEFGANLADFLLHFIADTNSEAVVIGGNIAQVFPLFSRSLLKGVHSRYPEIFVAPSILNEHAALIGAACFGNL